MYKPNFIEDLVKKEKLLKTKTKHRVAFRK